MQCNPFEYIRTIPFQLISANFAYEMHIAHDTEHNFAYYIFKIRLQNTYNKFRVHFLIAAFIIMGSMVFFAPVIQRIGVNCIN